MRLLSLAFLGRGVLLGCGQAGAVPTSYSSGLAHEEQLAGRSEAQLVTIIIETERIEEHQAGQGRRDGA